MTAIEKLTQRISDLSKYEDFRTRAIRAVLNPDNVSFFRRIVETGNYENTGGIPGLQELITIKLYPDSIIGIVVLIRSAIESIWQEAQAGARTQNAENNATGKPGPKGPRSNTTRRRLDIKTVAAEHDIRQKGKGWETKACMHLNEMGTPLPSKELRMRHKDSTHPKGNWLSWLRTDRENFLKRWSRDVNSD